MCVDFFLSYFGLVQGKKVNSTTWTLHEKWMMRQILYIVICLTKLTFPSAQLFFWWIWHGKKMANPRDVKAASWNLFKRNRLTIEPKGCDATMGRNMKCIEIYADWVLCGQFFFCVVQFFLVINIAKW